MTETHTTEKDMIHSSKEKPIKNKSTKFSQQDVDLENTPLFFPYGFRNYL